MKPHLTFESQIDQHQKLAERDPALFAILVNVYLKHNEAKEIKLVEEIEKNEY